MVPSKRTRSESRRSSILKPRKPRQPLQNVNFDSSSSENSPATSKVKRRVSFAEKNMSKFCHSTEQGTVWDNTYEEHDFSVKGSFMVDQNVEVESKESNISLGYAALPNKCFVSKDVTSNGIVEYSDTDEECIELPNEENQFPQSVITNISHTSKNIKSRNITIYRDSDQEDYTNNVVNRYCKSCDVSKDAVSSDIVEYNNTDEDCLELSNEKSQSRQPITNISHMSKTVKSNITIYRDSDEENYVNNIVNNSKSCPNNINSELNRTHVQNLSMELTAPISMFLSSEEQKEQKRNDINYLDTNAEEQKRNDINNLDTNCIINCNNVMEITETIPIFAKSVASDLGISKQIPTILQNCGNTKWNVTNIHNTTDVNYANDSMVLTSVIQPCTHVASTGTNNTAFHSIEMISVPLKMYEKNIYSENIVEGNDLRENQTEIFNDVSMEMTKPVNTILSSNVYNKENKENLKMNEPTSRDDRTMFFHNVSMEMTKTVSTKSKEITDTNTCKSLSEETLHGEKDVNVSVYFNEGTRILCKSMEFTEAVPTPLYHERMFHVPHIAQCVNKGTYEDYKNDRAKSFNDASMEITKSVNMLPLNIDKENLKVSSILKNDKSTVFHNVSMEMTTEVSSKNRNEITRSIISTAISKENTYGEKNPNNSTCFNEETKLLCKSMEFTEVVPVSVHDERTLDITHTTLSQTLSKTISLPAENSAKIAFQTDAIANKRNQDISIEITAAMPSTLQLTQNAKINENLINSKNDEFQHLTTNSNLTKLNKNTMKENFTISKEIVETEDIRHNELPNIVVTQSSLGNLDHSLNANFKNASGKKRMSNASEQSYSKRVRGSFMEVQSSQKNDIHSSLNANTNDVNDIECNECFAKDIIDYMQVSDSNLSCSLNEISEPSFLRESLSYLENDLVEPQSIKSPSFVCLDNKEKNSPHGIRHELQSSAITDIPVNNTSNPLIINNVIESKCLKEELINIENNQTQHCHGSIIVDKTEDYRATNCQTIIKTIINDNRLNQSNYTTKDINEEGLLSMNAESGKILTVQDVDYSISMIKEVEVTGEDQISKSRSNREHIQKKISEDAKLPKLKIKKREQYSDKERQETEKCNDHLEGIGAVIEGEIDFEKRRKNLNGKVKQQYMEQKDECVTKRLITAQYISTIDNVKNRFLIEQDPFLILSQKLETHSVRDDCIWNVCHKNIDKKMIVFGFMSNSLLIATFLSHNFNGSEENLIKEIKVISRISDDAGIVIKIVHKLILEKINTEILTKLYNTHQDILPMLNFISQDVKLTMDFMFDLRNLDDFNLMEINLDEISFVSRSKWMDIIVRVTLKVKQFDKLTSNDININCLLGRIKETDIKNLIKNIKKDHKFLRRYMNDVKDYIDIIEETSK